MYLGELWDLFGDVIIKKESQLKPLLEEMFFNKQYLPAVVMMVVELHF